MRTLNTGEKSIEEVRPSVRVVCRGVEGAEEGCIEFVQRVVKMRIKVPPTAEIDRSRYHRIFTAPVGGTSDAVNDARSQLKYTVQWLHSV